MKIKVKSDLNIKVTIRYILIIVILSLAIMGIHNNANRQIAKAQAEVERYREAKTWAMKFLAELETEELAVQYWLIDRNRQQLEQFRHGQKLLWLYREKMLDLLENDDRMQNNLRKAVEPMMNYLADVADRLPYNSDHRKRLTEGDVKAKLATGFQDVGRFFTDLEYSQEQAVNRLSAVSRRERRYLLLLMTGLVGLAIMIGYLLTRKSTKSLHKLLNAVQKAGSGEYQLITGVKPRDLIYSVAIAYNRMIGIIQTNQTALQDQNEELMAQGQELTAQNEEILAQQDELQQTVANLTKHRELLSRLYEFSQSLTETIDLDRLVEIAFDGILAEANSQVGALLLYNTTTEALEVKIATGLVALAPGTQLKFNGSLAGRAARERQPLVVGYHEGQLSTQGLQGQLAMASEIYLPLVFHDQLLGVIALGRTGKNSFSLERQTLLSSIAAQISVALHNALAHLELQRSFQHVQEVDHLKSELISTVSHELRTPLSSIFGFTELLLKKPPGATQANKYLTVIHQEARRLTELLNNFLDLQRIENSRFDFKPQPVDLGTLIRDSVAIYQGQSSKHQFLIKVEAGLPPVKTVPDRLTQVLGNLLSNAIKYSPEGGKIEITAFRRSEKEVEIAVKDQGLGIPREALPKLFQPFFRVDNSNRRQIGGTGLGLAICQQTLRALGGEIWVRSEYGKGSTFICSLPLG
jgi:signal transduction histidine kinase/methyl-accepting chemotaxis protein